MFHVAPGLGGIVDDGDEAHRAGAAWAAKRVDLEAVSKQFGPRNARATLEQVALGRRSQHGLIERVGRWPGARASWLRARLHVRIRASIASPGVRASRLRPRVTPNATDGARPRNPRAPYGSPMTDTAAVLKYGSAIPNAPFADWPQQTTRPVLSRAHE